MNRAPVALLLAAGLCAACSEPAGTEAPRPAERREEKPAAPRTLIPADPNVVFIVMDMLRADRVSSCGYDRPTTPNLDAFARGDGTTATCLAYAPGTWTLASHASYLTGEEVPIHGAEFMLHPEGKESVALWGEPARPLAEEFETLAETFLARGYETVLVSGNPIVSRRNATGLAQGFDIVRDTDRFEAMFGDALVAAAKEALGRARESGKPLFLFVNVSDIHHPWAPIPEGLAWAPARPGLDNRPRFPDNPYPRFTRGEIRGEERARFLAHVADSYDYAVWRADRTFGALLALLERSGALAGPNRIVVTSDHGELLGEHELLGHGLFVHEGVTRVPLLFRASAGPARLDATKPLSALTAYDLAARGALPREPREVRAAGFPDGLLAELFGERFSKAQAASWDGSEKLLWSDGAYRRVDLAADPGELEPAALAADHPRRAALERFVARMEKTAERAGAPSKEMIEALRALGYVK